MTTNQAGRVKFGWSEWIALASLSLGPALGGLGWGYTMTARVAAVERTCERVDARVELLVRVDERLQAIERRVASLESRAK